MTFRTPTGQTGPDAYVFEAAQIANAQRELDERFQRLLGTVRTEAPYMLACTSDYAFGGGNSAKSFIDYLRERQGAVE